MDQPRKVSAVVAYAVRNNNYIKYSNDPEFRKLEQEFRDTLRETVTENLTKDKQEFGWLIESIYSRRETQPVWFSLKNDDIGEWVTDSNLAVRFARQIDAEDFIKSHALINCIPTSHIWMNK